MNAETPELDAAFPACLADLTGPQLRLVRAMIEGLTAAAGKIDPHAEFSLIRDHEAVTVTLTVSVPLGDDT